MQTLISYFPELTDPRVDGSKDHLMEDIILTTIAAVICGAETRNDIEHYGRSKESRLKQYLQLPNGIPSHDTLNRFFSALDPDEFEQAFPSWIKDVSELTDGDAVSIDGKTVCGSRDGDSKRAIHIVSARSKASRLSLGQVRVNEKSNEITAIPRLLDVLVLKGCLVAMDATGCRRDIAARITEKGADCLLAVKDNRGCLEEDAERTVRFTRPTSEWIEEDSGHGRIERRKCTLHTDLSFVDRAEAWKNPSATVKTEAARCIKSSGKEEKEVRLYITSSKANAEVTGKGVRSHWGIENNLHWQLDVSFNEDESRKREGYAAQNFSLPNRIALNPVKHEQSKKRSVKGKRPDAGWNNDYLLKILTN